ncbi:MAG: DUF1361 domain-containing protein [Bacteroidota bacterium]
MKPHPFFRSARQAKLFALLLLSTLFCFALIGVRLHLLGIDLAEVQSTQDLLALKSTSTFLFLVWNLFLAWMPYGLALTAGFWYRRRGWSAFTVVLLLAWLFFFPNAPYILTDLLHLRGRHPVPHWYDLMLIVSFAWTGLLLGYLSLFEVQGLIQQRWNRVIAWLSSTVAIFLCGLGIYLGRYLRWNSWDILRQPQRIVGDAWRSLVDPSGQTGEGIIWVSAGFLFIGYLTLVVLMGQDEPQNHPSCNEV